MRWLIRVGVCFAFVCAMWIGRGSGVETRRPPGPTSPYDVPEPRTKHRQPLTEEEASKIAERYLNDEKRLLDALSQTDADGRPAAESHIAARILNDRRRRELNQGEQLPKELVQFLTFYITEGKVEPFGWELKGHVFTWYPYAEAIALRGPDATTTMVQLIASWREKSVIVSGVEMQLYAYVLACQFGFDAKGKQAARDYLYTFKGKFQSPDLFERLLAEIGRVEWGTIPAWHEPKVAGANAECRH